MTSSEGKSMTDTEEKNSSSAQLFRQAKGLPWYDILKPVLRRRFYRWLSQKETIDDLLEKPGFGYWWVTWAGVQYHVNRRRAIYDHIRRRFGQKKYEEFRRRARIKVRDSKAWKEAQEEGENFLQVVGQPHADLTVAVPLPMTGLPKFLAYLRLAGIDARHIADRFGLELADVNKMLTPEVIENVSTAMIETGKLAVTDTFFYLHALWTAKIFAMEIPKLPVIQSALRFNLELLNTLGKIVEGQKKGEGPEATLTEIMETDRATLRQRHRQFLKVSQKVRIPPDTTIEDLAKGHTPREITEGETDHEEETPDEESDAGTEEMDT